MSILIAKDRVTEPLYVVVPFFNPWRWKSRVKHTERALKHFHDSGAVIVLVEVAFNRREFSFADSGLDGTVANCSIHGEFKHKYLPLRTKDELWLKENSINVAVQHLPYDWKQVAWLDSDIHFVRPNWVGECIHKLQHYSWLQMFSNARDLAPNYELLPEDYPHAAGISWMAAYHRGLLDQALKSGGQAMPKQHGYPVGRVWPGLAWACTREAWDAVGGLLDFAIWGGGDYHLAHCIIGRRTGMMNPNLHPNYRNLVNEYFERCERFIRRNVGAMEGTVFHAWHGPKTERGYGLKHSVLAEVGFDPIRHLKRDFQGLYQLNDDGSEAFILLRDMMRAIAKQRNEDSNDVSLPSVQGH